MATLIRHLVTLKDQASASALMDATERVPPKKIPRGGKVSLCRPQWRAMLRHGRPKALGLPSGPATPQKNP